MLNLSGRRSTLFQLFNYFSWCCYYRYRHHHHIISIVISSSLSFVLDFYLLYRKTCHRQLRYWLFVSVVAMIAFYSYSQYVNSFIIYCYLYHYDLDYFLLFLPLLLHVSIIIIGKLVNECDNIYNTITLIFVKSPIPEVWSGVSQTCKVRS